MNTKLKDYFSKVMNLNLNDQTIEEIERIAVEGLKPEIKIPNEQSFQSLMKKHGNFRLLTNKKVYDELVNSIKLLNRIVEIQD